MVIHGALTSRQRESAQKFYNWFSVVNGLSYMCLGETLIILFAVKLGCRDWFVSALGGMIYFGFLLLPLGKWVTARVGAARTQTVFWYLRNVVSAVIASCALWSVWGFPRFSLGLLLTGSFLFYGFRAAGVVMSQPLVGDITTSATRARFISINSGIFQVAGIVSLLAITALLKISQSLWMLAGIITAGAVLGAFSATFINRIDETDRIRAAARRPIVGDLGKLLRSLSFRRILVAGTLINVAIILVVPICTLALKRGYGVGDAEALLYSLAQFTGAALGCFMTGKLVDRFGCGRVITGFLLVLLAAAACWVCAPGMLRVGMMLTVFFCAGIGASGMTTGMTAAFIEETTDDNRVAASIFFAVINGAGAGILGMTFGGTLLKVIEYFQNGAPSLGGYRLYFLIVLLILLPGVWFMLRLPNRRNAR